MPRETQPGNRTGERAASRGRPADGQAADDRPHVLIAEDEVHIARMLGTLLEDAAVRVTVTTDGAAALEHIRSDPTVSLVILDLMMPEMSGLEVLRELRRASELPVVVLTAKGESDVREQAMTLGATELFIKPFSPRKLVGRVLDLCGP